MFAVVCVALATPNYTPLFITLYRHQARATTDKMYDDPASAPSRQHSVLKMQISATVSMPITLSYILRITVEDRHSDSADQSAYGNCSGLRARRIYHKLTLQSSPYSHDPQAESTASILLLIITIAQSRTTVVHTCDRLIDRCLGYIYDCDASLLT